MKNGWEMKRLDEIMLVERGGSPRPIQKYLTKDPDGLNWIKISDATASTKYIYKTKEKITRAGLNKTREVNEGDFILSNSMSFGRPYIMKTSGCIHDGWLVLRDKKKIELDQDFLYYTLSSPNIFQQFDALAAGSTVRNLNIGLVSSVEIPVPPIEEQRGIVAILDEAFACIDKAKANTEKNIRNARELFDSYLNNIFSNPGDDSSKERLGHVAELRGRIGWRGLTAKEYQDSGPLFLSVHSLNYGDYVDFRDAYHITEKRYAESPEIMLQKDDVLICKDGAGIGKVGIVGKLPDRATVNSSLLLIRCGSSILPKYMLRCLMSPYFQNIVNSRLEGATTPHLYQRDITTFPILVPSIDEQQKTTTKLDALSSHISEIEKYYRRQLDKLDETRRAVLQKAFTGDL